MMQPLITVIVPVYKAEKYLRRCVKSIQNQSYENLEIILVDDGSPDSSGALCETLAGEDSRIRVIHKQNGGLSSARNAGLDAMTGDYVGFVDADDWVDSEMYQLLYEQLINCDAQISCCGIAVCDDETVHYCFNPQTDQNLILNTEEALCELTYNFRITNSVCDKLYCAEIFKDLRMRTGVLYEDAQVQPFCIARARRVCYMASAMYHYYMSPNSLLRGAFSLQHLDILRASEERMELYAQQYPQALPYAQAAHVVICMDLIYKSRNASVWDDKRKELVRIVRQPMSAEAYKKLLKTCRLRRLLLCIHTKLYLFCMTLRQKK